LRSPEPAADLLGRRVQAFRPAQARRRIRDQVPGTLADSIQLRYRLIQVDPDPPYQPGRADELAQGFTERLSAGHVTPRATDSAASAA
jgi:hypothetical protein